MIFFGTFYHYIFGMVTKSRSQIFDAVTYPSLQNRFEKTP